MMGFLTKKLYLAREQVPQTPQLGKTTERALEVSFVLLRNSSYANIFSIIMNGRFYLPRKILVTAIGKPGVP